MGQRKSTWAAQKMLPMQESTVGRKQQTCKQESSKKRHISISKQEALDRLCMETANCSCWGKAFFD